MQLKKQKLITIDQPYSVSTFTFMGQPAAIAASERVGGECMILVGDNAYPIEGLDGGFMNIVPIPECENAFLTIQRFYPVFVSEKAQVVLVRACAPDCDGLIHAEILPLFDLPYVHRIGLIGSPGNRKIAAGALCASKAFTDDWSQPGAIYLYDFDTALGTVGEARCVLEPLHKNHGMATAPQSGQYELLVCGEQGIYAIEEGQATQILASETSDVCMLDIDGDGQEALFTIQGFHGDTFAVYKKAGDEWQRAFTYPLAFGHVLWAGMIAGRACALSGSRAGDKALTLHEFTADGVKSTLIDAPSGPTQIAVEVQCDGAKIYASNPGTSEIALYDIRF